MMNIEEGLKNKKSVCAQCGKGLPEDALFCEYCGCKVEKIEVKKPEVIAIVENDTNVIEEIIETVLGDEDIPVENTITEDKKVCKKCGKEIDEDSMFCEYCGCKIEQAEKLQSMEEKSIITDAATEDKNTIQQKRQYTSIRKKICIGVLIILAVLGMLLVYSKMTDKPTENTSTSASIEIEEIEEVEEIDNEQKEIEEVVEKEEEQAIEEEEEIIESNLISDEELEWQKEQYIPIADVYYSAVTQDWSNEVFKETGLNNLASSQYMWNSYIGYCYEDIDSNGTIELIIGSVRQDESSTSYVLDVFTLNEGSPVLAFRSGERSMYRLCEGGYFSLDGSSGAESSSTEIYKIAEFGMATLVECVAYDGTIDENSYFYSTTANILNLEALNQFVSISQEKAFEIMNKYQEKSVEFTPFTDHIPTKIIILPEEEEVEPLLIDMQDFITCNALGDTLWSSYEEGWVQSWAFQYINGGATAPYIYDEELGRDVYRYYFEDGQSYDGEWSFFGITRADAAQYGWAHIWDELMIQE